MNATQMSIAYSPRSEVLEDVVRSAITNMIIQNADLIPEIIEQLPESLRPNVTVTIPESIRNITSQWSITLPEIITIPVNIIPDKVWPVLSIFLRSIIQVTPYDKSLELRGLYAKETDTRKVIAAVEFDDALYGKSTKTDLPLFNSWIEISRNCIEANLNKILS